MHCGKERLSSVERLEGKADFHGEVGNSRGKVQYLLEMPFGLRREGGKIHSGGNRCIVESGKNSGRAGLSPARRGRKGCILEERLFCKMQELHHFCRLCRPVILPFCRPVCLPPIVTRCHPPSSGCFVRPVNAPDQLRRGLYLAVPWRRVHFLGGGAAPGGGGSL